MWRAFRQNKRATIAVNAAIMMVGMLAMTGAAIDCSGIYEVEMRMQTAADSAALSGARNLLDYVSQNGQGTVSSYLPSVQSLTQNVVYANLQTERSITGLAVATPVVSYSNSKGTVSLTVSAQYKPVLMNAFGLGPMRLTASATSTSSSSGTYYQIVFLVDMSQSMAVGATYNDIQSTVVHFGCTFACHQAGSDTLQLGRSLYGIKFKIDYARQGVESFISQLQSVASQSGSTYYSTGIYLFSDHLQTLIAPTQNLAAVANAAQNIDVEWLAVAPVLTTIGHTQIPNALTTLANTLPHLGGDGSSASTPKTILVLVTDGADDPIGTGLWAGPADGNWGSACSIFKNNKANVYTLNAYYYPFTMDGGYYNTYVAAQAQQIQDAFLTCASTPGNALLATDGPGILAAANQLFQQIMATTVRVSG